MTYLQVHHGPALRTTLVAPCFNEARRLDVAAIETFLASPKSKGVDLMFVDDGSTDETPTILAELCGRQSDRARFLRMEVNGGKANAVRLGILAALDRQCDFVGYWDADLATPLDAVSDFLDVFLRRGDVELVMGSRVSLLGRDVRRRWTRHALGRCFAHAASRVLRMAVYDTQCGAKLFRVDDRTAELFAEPFCSRWIFDVELLARMAARRLDEERAGAATVYELPLDRWCDVAGSRVRLRDFGRAGFDLARIHRRYRAALQQPGRAEGPQAPALPTSPTSQTIRRAA